MSRSLCSIPDCDRFVAGNGYCRMHYGRWLRHGDPNAVLLPRPATERFWEKVDKDSENGCWVWTAFRDRLGYGHFRVEGKTVAAYRWAYLELVGPIPDGLVLDHLCRNPPCVNPSHLEAVTQQVNMQRAFSACGAKSHCPQGHPYAGGNLYIDPRGYRGCRACRSVQGRRRRAS